MRKKTAPTSLDRPHSTKIRRGATQATRGRTTTFRKSWEEGWRLEKNERRSGGDVNRCHGYPRSWGRCQGQSIARPAHVRDARLWSKAIEASFLKAIGYHCRINLDLALTSIGLCAKREALHHFHIQKASHSIKWRHKKPLWCWLPEGSVPSLTKNGDERKRLLSGNRAACHENFHSFRRDLNLAHSPMPRFCSKLSK